MAVVDHARRLFPNPFFVPKPAKELDVSVRGACVELIGKFENAGGCEFVKEFAIPFPSYVFLDLMGMPRGKLEDFIAWEDGLMRAPDPMERMSAARAIYAYLAEHKEQQKLAPANEFLAAMVSGEVDGRLLDHPELMGMFYVLYVGGLDTVYSTIGWTMKYLATHSGTATTPAGRPGPYPACGGGILPRVFGGQYASAGGQGLHLSWRADEGR